MECGCSIDGGIYGKVSERKTWNIKSRYCECSRAY
jgi:hypothetical protein